ncbi:MAG: radical SAM protein [Planctomycetes bacterium]|nr:radical SAM protein [Planctomycetota bacterium]
MIHGLAFYYTLRCNATCGHCGVWSSPDRSETMDLGRAEGYLQSLAQLPARPDRAVVFLGGEPLLFLEEICTLIDRATRLGFQTQVSTNGFWASTAERTRATVERLQRAGLTHLALSASPYHTEFVDPANLGRALAAARSTGIIRKLQIITHRAGPAESEVLEQIGLPAEEVQDEVVYQAHRRDPDFDALAHVFVRRTPAAPFGRGAFLNGHVERFPLHEVESIPCYMVRRFPLLYPNGDLYSCCCVAGFYEPYRIGNLDREPLADLERRMESNPVFEAIAKVGPVDLARFSGFEEKTSPGARFSHMCHVCREMMTGTDPAELEEKARGRLLLYQIAGGPEVTVYDELL